MIDETQAAAQNDTDAAGTGPDATAATPPEGDNTPPAEGEQATETTTSTDSNEGEGEQSTEAQGAPEQYGDFNYPEGYQMDEAASADFQSVAKELNLSQEDAQKLIDFDGKRFEATVQAQQDQWQNVQADWKKAIETDDELGGSRYDQSMSLVSKVLDTFGNDKLRSFLNESGLGNHPEMIRALAKMGGAISEDRLVSGEGGDASSRPFYKNSNMQR